MPLPSGGNIAIPAIETIANPKKTRIALVQGPQLVSAPATAVSDALGVPAGGTSGQVLTKSTDTDYDSDWADIPASGDFAGPASSVDGNLVAFDGTTGKLGKDSGKKASDFATAAQGALADSATQPGDLGNSASRNVGTTTGTVAAGDDSRITGAAQSTDLASTASGKGASLIGIQDAAANYTATTVEAALAEIATDIAAINPDYGAGNAALSQGAIGTYTMAQKTNSGTMAIGATIAGSNLKLVTLGSISTTSPSGTWRLMSGNLAGGTTSFTATFCGLFLRIS